MRTAAVSQMRLPVPDSDCWFSCVRGTVMERGEDSLGTLLLRACKWSPRATSHLPWTRWMRLLHALGCFLRGADSGGEDSRVGHVQRQCIRAGGVVRCGAGPRGAQAGGDAERLQVRSSPPPAHAHTCSVRRFCLCSGAPAPRGRAGSRCLTCISRVLSNSMHDGWAYVVVGVVWTKSHRPARGGERRDGGQQPLQRKRWVHGVQRPRGYAHTHTHTTLPPCIEWR